MPYIHPDQRAELDKWINEIILLDLPPGELNYTITKLLLKTKPKSYHNYNTLIGVLECCKLELYRKALAPYEDEKCAENGEVYGQEG